MIYADLTAFNNACKEYAQSKMSNPEAHQWTATFTLGDPGNGYHLRADSTGWRKTLNAVTVANTLHLASPLANLQAACL